MGTTVLSAPRKQLCRCARKSAQVGGAQMSAAARTATACAGWFAFEAAAHQVWIRAGCRADGNQSAHRLAVLSVRLGHAVIASLLSGCVLMDAGLGMGGEFDRNPCSSLPASNAAIEISL